MKFCITLTGPSGAGKSTLESMLAERGVVKCVSTTTRAPRAGEINGEHYYFVTPEEFEAIDARQGFAENIAFGSCRYGLTIAEVQRVTASGRPAVFVAEPNGVRQISRILPAYGVNVRKVFIDVPQAMQYDRLIRRLLGDFVLGHCNEVVKTESLIKRYTERLVQMTTTEAGWKMMNEWDFIVPEFTPETQEEVIDTILCSVGY